MNMENRFSKIIAALAVISLFFCLSACGGSDTAPTTDTTSQKTDEQTTPGSAVIPTDSKSEETEENPIMKTLTMKIDGKKVAVDWEENDSVTALAKLVKDKPLTIKMSVYGGFEQVGPLGTGLPRNDAQTTTQAGDIVLYSGDRIVVFYGSNSWAYTRLGHVSDKTQQELTELLSNGDVTVTLI